VCGEAAGSTLADPNRPQHLGIQNKNNYTFIQPQSADMHKTRPPAMTLPASSTQCCELNAQACSGLPPSPGLRWHHVQPVCSHLQVCAAACVCCNVHPVISPFGWFRGQCCCGPQAYDRSAKAAEGCCSLKSCLGQVKGCLCTAVLGGLLRETIR
jgi:hypothetical protein